MMAAAARADDDADRRAAGARRERARHGVDARSSRLSRHGASQVRALSRGVSVARDAPEASGAWALGADDDVTLGDRFAPRSIDAAALGLDNDTSAHVVSARDARLGGGVGEACGEARRARARRRARRRARARR